MQDLKPCKVKKSPSPLIFIIDKNKPYQIITQQYLSLSGYYNTLIFSDYSECLKYIDLKPDIIISEYFEPANLISSEAFSKIVKKQNSKTFLIFFTSYHDLNEAVKLMKLGAVDYILKSKSAYNMLVLHIKSIMKYRTDIIKNNNINKRIAASIGILAVLTGFLVVLYNSSIFN